jgi:hypothetical protein
MALTDATVVSGVAAAVGSNAGTADRIVKQTTNEIFRYGPNLNPLIRMADVMKRRSVKNMEFTILNDKRLPRFTRINNGAGYSNSATSIVVDNGNYFRVQDLMQVTRTKEQSFVTAISGNTLTVIRGYDTAGAGTGVAMVDNDEVRNLGQAQSERSGTPASIQTDPGSIVNYCMIVSRSMNVSTIRMATEEYGEEEMKRQARATMDEMKIDAELDFKFAKPIADVQGSSPIDSSLSDGRWVTGGLEHFISTYASENALDANTVITQKTLWDHLAPLFENMPDDSTNQNRELVVLCGIKAFHAFHQWGLTPIQTTPQTKRYGLALTSYQAPVGLLNLVQDYTLKGDEYADYAMIVNPSDLEYVFLEGLDVKVYPNKDVDNRKEKLDEIWGTLGLGIKRPELHGYIYNMQAGA